MTNKNRYESITIFVADSPLTDARSFPGGKVIVYRGLLKFVANEAALVGILGHELSHIDRQHQLEQFKNSLLAQDALSKGGQNFGQFAGFGQLMMKSFMTPYALDQEKEADSDGCLWAFQAGYDPHEMAEVFRRLSIRDKKNTNSRSEFFTQSPLPYRSIYGDPRLESQACRGGAE